jgi:ADP-heptose:LPS heptosyltransferase
MKISIFLSNNEIFAAILENIILLLIKSVRFLLKLIGRSPDNDIAVISFHKLGDSVFTMPAINEIKNYYKKDVYIFCNEESGPIFELFFKKQFILGFKYSDFYFSRRVSGRTIKRKLRNINPEIIFDLTGSTLSASLLFSSNAKDIIGINEKYYKPIFTKYVPIRITPHVMDIYLDAIRLVIPPYVKSNKEFPIEIKEDGYILIHPFAGWKAKEWNFNKFIQLAKLLDLEYMLKIISHSGGINAAVQQEINTQGIEVIECNDINKLIEVIKDSSLIISNDSGPIYIANILGKPTCTIYGPTNPEFSLPLGRYHKFIAKKINCSPEKDKQYCFTDGGRRGCPSFECMNRLTVKEVFTQLELFLSELKLKKKSTVIYYK